MEAATISTIESIYEATSVTAIIVNTETDVPNCTSESVLNLDSDAED